MNVTWAFFLKSSTPKAPEALLWETGENTFDSSLKNNNSLFRSEHQKAERDVQGAGGGGLHHSYENPALDLSSETFNSRHRHDSSFMGSNDFIGE